MLITLHEQPALIDAVTVGAERPIAFLVGSPLSWDKDGGVPGVEEMLNVARTLIKSKLIHRLPDFERAIDGLSGADAYQACMKWVHGSLTQAGVNEVIRQAVLKARLRSSLPNFIGDGEPLDWHLPAGTRGLAALIAGGGDRYCGPILTTNFDPLLSLSIRDVGLRRRLRVIDADGTLPTAVEADPGEIDIIHLHGYWQGASTLHTPSQLISARPKLTASLRRLLQQRTLVVVAYSGWDDVFTRALVDVLQDPEAQVTILWCFRETDPTLVATRYSDLLTKSQNAITSGAMHLYGGVDCHTVFGEMAKISSKTPSAFITNATISPLPGWQRLSRPFLDSLTTLKAAETLRYFDGAPPTWRHIVSNVIPVLSTFSHIKSAWDDLPDDQCSVQLIRATGGEGKSTLLMQASIEAIKCNNWEVLYRPSSQLGLSSEVVCGLDDTKQWLLVIDDADNIVESIYECLNALHHQNLSNVDFLLAARNADWHAARGESKSWAKLCKRQPDVVLRGIKTEEDAMEIVKAWQKFGSQGLRDLAKYENLDAMTEALLKSVKASQNDRREGSLLGGLLDVRFSPQALRDHVRELMERLASQVIRDSKYTLQDALVYIAACHGAGMAGIDSTVLADILNIPRAWINSWLVSPLGEEAVGSASGKCIFTRHRKVADAVLSVAESTFFFDLTEIWTVLIQQSVKTKETTAVANFTHLMHISPSLQRSLPTILSEERRFEIALVAAHVALAQAPNRLDQITDLGRTYRAGGDFNKAATVFRKGSARIKPCTDYLENIRGYWYEWGICEGLSGSEPTFALTNIWLGSVAISDNLNPSPISDDDISLSCAGIGVAFGRLAEQRSDCPFALGRRATIWLGRISSPNKRTHAYFDRQEVEANKFNTPKPNNLAEAIEWLTNGANAAAAQLNGSAIATMIKLGKVTFVQLHTILFPRIT